MAELFECPFCPCVFACNADLERHLAVFGRNRHVHVAKMKRLRRESEFELSRLYGGADKQIRVLARIIESGKHG